MKKTLFMILGTALTAINLFAGGRFIHIEYSHSLRLPYADIAIELGSENNNGRVFYARLRTTSAEQGQSDRSVTEKIMNIDREYFDDVYNRLLNLNFKEIIRTYENRVSVDGIEVSITVGTRQNNIRINLRNPDSSSLEAEEFLMVLYKLFLLFDMQEWL